MYQGPYVSMDDAYREYQDPLENKTEDNYLVGGTRWFKSMQQLQREREQYKKSRQQRQFDRRKQMEQEMTRQREQLKREMQRQQFDQQHKQMERELTRQREQLKREMQQELAREREKYKQEPARPVTSAPQSETCQLCFDRKLDAAYSCGHMSCYVCGIETIEHFNFCPFCKQEGVTIIKLYK